MEILIAILWYLQVLVAGGSYTQSDINTMANQNQVQIKAIQADQQKTSIIYTNYTQSGQSVNLVEPWEDELPPPIHN